MLKAVFTSLLLAAGFAASNAQASEILLCTTCTSQATFDTFGEATVSTRTTGQYEFTIVNWDSESAYEVTVLKYYDLELHQMFVEVSSTASSQQVLDDLAAVKEALAKAEEAFPLTGGEGTNTFGTHTREMVGAQIAATDWYQSLTSPFKRGLIRAYKQGTESIDVVVVFPNGDVAQFTVHPASTAATCCEYKPGTARNVNGEYISDTGFGGTGAPTGGDYVERDDDTDPTWGIRLRIQMDTWVYYSCASQGGGPWICTKTS